MPSEAVREAATLKVIELLTAAHGADIAGFWVWERTPLPGALPTDEQLGEGLLMAMTPPDA